VSRRFDASSPGGAEEEGPRQGGGGGALRERARVYGFFSAVFAREPTQEAIEAFRAGEIAARLEGLGATDALRSLSGDPGRVAEKLALEYARLFIGPRPLLPPYQSCRSGEGKGRLWSKETSRVYRHVKDLGLDFGKAYRGIPDHIALVLELVQLLLEEEAAAIEAGERDRAARIGRARLLVFEDHVEPWARRFFMDVERETDHSFYEAMARLAARFLEGEERLAEEEGGGRS